MRRPSRRVLVTGALALVVLGTCGAVLHARTSGPGQGPLETGSGTSAYVVHADVGRVFADESVVLYTKGSGRPTFLRFESLGAEGALELLGARLVSPRRAISSSYGPMPWPPTTANHEGAAWVRKAEGLRGEPGRDTYRENGYQLVLGYRITSAAFAARTGVRVTYRVGGTTYRTTLRDGIALCPGTGDAAEEACLDRALARIPEP